MFFIFGGGECGGTVKLSRLQYCLNGMSSLAYAYSSGRVKLDLIGTSFCLVLLCTQWELWCNRGCEVKGKNLSTNADTHLQVTDFLFSPTVLNDHSSVAVYKIIQIPALQNPCWTVLVLGWGL